MVGSDGMGWSFFSLLEAARGENSPYCLALARRGLCKHILTQQLSGTQG